MLRVCVLVALLGVVRVALASRQLTSVARIKEEKREFDYYMFVRQWPGSYCSKHACPLLRDTSFHFTIHGLWPNYNDGTWPQFCDANYKFDEEEIADIEDAMEEEWPSFMNTDADFWEHEWSKHGTCALKEFPSEHKYFKTILKLHWKFDLAAAFRAADIIPRKGHAYRRTELVTAVEDMYGARPLIHCYNGELSEVWMCVGKDLRPFDCDATHESSSCESVTIPPLPPRRGRSARSMASAASPYDFSQEEEWGTAEEALEAAAAALNAGDPGLQGESRTEAGPAGGDAGAAADGLLASLNSLAHAAHAAVWEQLGVLVGHAGAGAAQDAGAAAMDVSDPDDDDDLLLYAYSLADEVASEAAASDAAVAEAAAWVADAAVAAVREAGVTGDLLSYGPSEPYDDSDPGGDEYSFGMLSLKELEVAAATRAANSDSDHPAAAAVAAVQRQRHEALYAELMEMGEEAGEAVVLDQAGLPLIVPLESVGAAGRTHGSAAGGRDALVLVLFGAAMAMAAAAVAAAGVVVAAVVRAWRRRRCGCACAHGSVVVAAAECGGVKKGAGAGLGEPLLYGKGGEAGVDAAAALRAGCVVVVPAAAARAQAAAAGPYAPLQ